ncbi:neural cell adhesion molecule 1 [Gouania willdenowi]|uniref:Neural cell adhesion molecule 1-like n=1 Tax=Gouania willdenowi TaxID=441366 RepID=A0A8C5D8R4_GOUWI|nr:neural cell adhesion molecule 1-like [Gouania willdenowi]
MNKHTEPLMVLLLLLQAYGSEAKMNIITSKLDVPVGDEIILLCKAGGEGDITWQKDGEEVDDEEIVFKVDETSSKLLIRKASLEDAGRYTCLCEFDSGHSDNTQIVLYVFEGPSFGSTATYHEFLEGTDGAVPCLVTGKPEVDVQWIRDKREISSTGTTRVRQMPDKTLVIEKVTREDAGTYICQAQIRGRGIYRELLISVVVNAPPVVRLKEEVKQVIAGADTNVSLLCLVDGLPQPNISWVMPVTFDPSHHHFNSDRSQLTIRSVSRADFGEYVCTASNKISESSATIFLHVFEAPQVVVSAEQQCVLVGERVSVACNVSGHPQPELHWLNKHTGHTIDSTSGRVSVVNGTLVLDEVVPSDGGFYSCMAVSSSGNASRDVAIFTQPGLPHDMSVSAGPTSVLFSLESPPTSGGTPITSYVLQWRQQPAEQWRETTVPASDKFAILRLNPYTVYTVRLAALNAVGVGQFSNENEVCTEGIQGEPDRPLLTSNAVKVEGTSFSVPVKLKNAGGSPLLHYSVRYRPSSDEAEWKEVQLPPTANNVSLKDLSFGSNYQVEVTAINANGSSEPVKVNFTTADKPTNPRSITKGIVVGIVMFLFLVVFLVVDATCCYTNRCGLLMTIAVKLFGQKAPVMKNLENGDDITKGEVHLRGITPIRDGVTGTQNSGQLAEITCDKAPLTKHEKLQLDRDLPSMDV